MLPGCLICIGTFALVDCISLIRLEHVLKHAPRHDEWRSSGEERQCDTNFRE